MNLLRENGRCAKSASVLIPEKSSEKITGVLGKNAENQRILNPSFSSNKYTDSRNPTDNPNNSTPISAFWHLSRKMKNGAKLDMSNNFLAARIF
jgi:hypothetical protein